MAAFVVRFECDEHMNIFCEHPLDDVRRITLCAQSGHAREADVGSQAAGTGEFKIYS